MADNLKEFTADHSGGDVVKGAVAADPVVAAGGPVQKRKADVDAKGNPVPFANPGALPVEAEEEDAFSESLATIFNGQDLSEDFKSKISLVFEAAVNEEASKKIQEALEAMEEEFQEKLEESINSAMDEVVENLDSYLDYVVNEWMEENQIAIESGMKVSMAESFMAGLKDLFEAHNIDLDESTIDVVSDLEEEISELKKNTNDLINENISLKREVEKFGAASVFNNISEGLTVSEVERFKILSEKLDTSDLDSYASDLSILKETFFNKKTNVVSEEVEEENEILTEETKPQRVSQYDSVNSIVSFLNSRD